MKTNDINKLACAVKANKLIINNLGDIFDDITKLKIGNLNDAFVTVYVDGDKTSLTTKFISEIKGL